MRSIYIIIIPLIILISCGEGLSPNLAKEEVGFSGRITFSGNWDPSISQTHVVVFKNPLNSVADFNVFNLSFVSSAIPNGVDEYFYSTSDGESLISSIEIGTYSYIAVAQSLKDSITLNREDWIVVGVYYSKSDSSSPGLVSLNEGTFLDSINIHCDFSNLPPQPPGGLPLTNINHN